MSAAFLTAAPASPPRPPQDRPDARASAAPQLSRSGTLLALVRKLFDYGQGIILVLRQETSLTQARVAEVASHFGSPNIKLIAARVMRGLQIALALNRRLIRSAARLDQPPAVSRAAPPRPAGPPPARRTRASRRHDPLADPDADDAALLDHVPTAQEIAARVMHRSIGEVLADICIDLGLTPAHPLWQELSMAIMCNRGRFMRVFAEAARRSHLAAREYARAVTTNTQGWAAALPDPLRDIAERAAELFGLAATRIAAAATGPP
ncbi:MAG TPA: hypothetical protein VGG99_22480 [Acetobacteraceae bacterium]|jgi:hypothetical protein